VLGAGPLRAAAHNHLPVDRTSPQELAPVRRRDRRCGRVASMRCALPSGCPGVFGPVPQPVL